MQALEYIDKNLDKELTLDIVADHLDLSTNYFSRLFNKKVGERFSRYINIQWNIGIKNYKLVEMDTEDIEE